MKKSDLMGRFDFDGAEGIAFWIGDSDTEPITKVMFDELETLKAFIEHNLPGMFGTDGGTNEPESREVRQERAKLVAVRDILNRDDFGDDWEHDEWVYRQAAERKLADIEEALGSVMLAVPDAATVESFSEALIKALMAERDAALAAIERVREEHQPCYGCIQPHCFRCKEAKWPCATFQALDGSPEHGELERARNLVNLREFEIDTLDELITELKAERDAALAEIESRIEDRDYWYGIANIAKSQRDAANEAIERVAVEIEAVADGITSSSEAAGYRNGLLRAAQIVRAALDGSPEPEWEERIAACEQHGTHCWSCARITERRRPAGPWLPVGGEGDE